MTTSMTHWEWDKKGNGKTCCMHLRPFILKKVFGELLCLILKQLFKIVWQFCGFGAQRVNSLNEWTDIKKDICKKHR